MAVKKNIVANYLGQGISALLNLAFVPVYIHYLGIEAYAIVGLFTVLQTWLILLDLGMTPTLSREMARFSAGAISLRTIRDLLRTLSLLGGGIAITITITMALSARFLASSWLKAGALPPGTIADVITIMSVVLALRFCEGIFRSALVGLQHQVWLNALTVVTATLRSLGTVAVLAFVSRTIEAFFLWQGLVSLFSLVALWLKLHRVLPKMAEPARFSVPALREVGGFAGGMFGISILSVLLTQIDKVILSRILPLDQLGYYMLAGSVSGMFLLFVGPVAQAVYPAFVRLAELGDTAALASIYHRSCQTVTVLLSPAVAILIAYPRVALFVWSNDGLLAGRTAPLLALLAAGTFLNALMNLPHLLQLAFGWTRLGLWFNVVVVVLLIPALIVLVPLLGPVAAAGAVVLFNAAYLLLQIPLMHRRLLPDEMQRWYLRDIALPIAACGIVVGLVRLLQGDHIDSRLGGVALLGATGAASAIAAALAADSVRGRGLDLVRAWLGRRAYADAAARLAATRIDSGS